MDSLFDRAANDRRHGAAEIERRLIDELLCARRRWTDDGLDRGASLLLATQEGFNRRWPIFEAVPMALVTDRIAE